MPKTRTAVLAVVLAAGAAGPMGNPVAVAPAGAAVAADRADFDGDGRGDLVVGIPQADVGGSADAGAVAVLYGSAGGLAAGQLWHRGNPGIEGAAAPGDQFGYSVATGDFDADGFTDLAVGAPFADVGGAVNAGTVNVLYGSRAGLHAAGDEIWHRSRAGIPGAPSTHDNFGFALAAANFDGPGPADLAIGIPGDDAGGVASAGSVTVMYGNAGFGFSGVGTQSWHRGTPGIDGVANTTDQFGRAVAAGDFDGDGRDDLAAGVPLDDVGAVSSAGSVHVIYGTGAGLRAAGDRIWHRGVAGVAGAPDGGNALGWDVTTADFDGDGRDDLAAGVPLDTVNGVAAAGSVSVLYGSAGSGLAAAGSQVWHRGVAGVVDAPGAGDELGWVLAAGDFDGDGRDDLAAGVPLDTVGSAPTAGSVHVFYGTAAGLGTARDTAWHRDRIGIDGLASTGDGFGYRLASGNFDGNLREDLAVGVPADDVGAALSAGSVHVLYGSGGGISYDGDEIVTRGSPAVGGAPTAGESFGSSVAG